MKIEKAAVSNVIRGIQWSSGIFALIMAVLLLATLIQTRIHDPVNSPALQKLIQRMEKDPSDQSMKEQIRALDLLVRKAYFTSWEQLKYGTLIFFTSLGVFLICWKLQFLIFPSMPSPPGELHFWWTRQTTSRKGVFAAGTVLICTALFGGVFFRGGFFRSAQFSEAAQEKAGRHWSTFRGPGGNGVAFYENAPTSWDGTSMKGIKWKTELPIDGNSSPVVWENRIFLTGGTKESREVFCFNLVNGKLMWRRKANVPSDSARAVPKVDNETGFAAPTAACDGQRVYAVFATGELVCFTVKGKPVWSRDLGPVENHYGHSSSLMVHNGLLFVQYDQYETGKLYAFSGATGEMVWQSGRKVLSWASPICVNTGERYELILADNESVTSYSPSTGTVLWSHNCLYGEVGPSPAYASGMVFVANEYASAVGIDLTNAGSDGVPPIKWEWREDLPNTASPVARDSLLFLATSGGTVSCVNAMTGETIWVEEFDEGFYSSPIISGRNVFLMDRKGTMQIFEASDKYIAVASPELGEPVVTTPAFLDGKIVIRADKHLFCIDGGK